MLAQTSAETEIRGPQFADGSPAFAEALAEARAFLDVPLEKIDISDMPTDWSWENVGGYNFTGRHQDQGHCGSCYLIATNSMLEARIKIWYGKEVHLSTQQRLDCSFINEGCHGGWGYLDGIFMEQYGAVAEECATYQGSMSPTGCATWA